MQKNSIFIWQGYWYGGAGAITLAAAQNFKAHGLDVTLGAYKKNDAVDIKQIIFREPHLMPSSFRSLATSIMWRIKYARNFQAVYAHTLGCWKTKNNALFIHDAADFDKKLQTSPSIPHKLAYFCWKTLYLHVSIKNATLLFATEDFSRYLRRNNIPENKIIPSGSFYDDNVFLFHKRQNPEHPYRLVFIGDTDDRVKNITYMIKNFYKHPDYIVDVLGGNKQGIDENFTYHGYQSKDYIFDILSKSHFFIMPSFSEGFSIALLEAAGAGIPCLVHEAALPVEAKDWPNIIPFSLRDNIHAIITAAAKNYSQYAEAPPTITRYAASTILKAEYEAIARCLK